MYIHIMELNPGLLTYLTSLLIKSIPSYYGHDIYTKNTTSMQSHLLVCRDIRAAIQLLFSSADLAVNETLLLG